MNIQHNWIMRTALLVPLLIGSATTSAFPEIPFCPLGGPPGWWNRITDDDHHYYPPPLYHPPPRAAPYWGPAYPYSYVPQNQVYTQPFTR